MLEVTGAVIVLAPDGKPNHNSRRTIALTVKDPSGRLLVERKRVWQDTRFVVGAASFGTYSMWCASSYTWQGTDCFGVVFVQKDQARDKHATRLCTLLWHLSVQGLHEKQV
jgi:hypothetical protein